MGVLRGTGYVVLVLLLGAGCAHGPSRETLLERSAAAHTYALPPPEVWREAMALLQKAGYRVPPPVDGEFVARTPWKMQGEWDLASVRTRYVVMGQKDEAGRFAVRFFLISYPTIGTTAPHPGVGNHRDGKANNTQPGEPYSPVKPSMRRDLKLELALLERLEPARARQLEQSVDRYLASGERPPVAPVAETGVPPGT